MFGLHFLVWKLCFERWRKALKNYLYWPYEKNMKGMKSILPIVINDITYIWKYTLHSTSNYLCINNYHTVGTLQSVSTHGWENLNTFKKFMVKLNFFCLKKVIKSMISKRCIRRCMVFFFNTDCLLNNLHFMIQRQCIYIIHRHYW